MSQETEIECGFCKSRHVSVETDVFDDEAHHGPAAVTTSSYYCGSCWAYTFNGRDVGPMATEEEMATGWHSNQEDSVLFSPFSFLGTRHARDMSQAFWSFQK